MAQYGLELETTTHLKGMSIGCSSDGDSDGTPKIDLSQKIISFGEGRPLLVNSDMAYRIGLVKKGSSDYELGDLRYSRDFSNPSLLFPYCREAIDFSNFCSLFYDENGDVDEDAMASQEDEISKRQNDLERIYGECLMADDASLPYLRQEENYRLGIKATYCQNIDEPPTVGSPYVVISPSIKIDIFDILPYGYFRQYSLKTVADLVLYYNDNVRCKKEYLKQPAVAYTMDYYMWMINLYISIWDTEYKDLPNLYIDALTGPAPADAVEFNEVYLENPAVIEINAVPLPLANQDDALYIVQQAKECMEEWKAIRSTIPETYSMQSRMRSTPTESINPFDKDFLASIKRDNEEFLSEIKSGLSLI